MRNKNKHSIRLAYTLLAGCLLLSCTEEEAGEEKHASPALQIQVEVQDFSPAASDQTPTRTAENGHTTTFTEGDFIGITSIKNGTILMDNIPYRLNAGGTWETESGARYKVTASEGAATTYIAYYPYDVAMTGKTTEEEIFDAFSVATDQSTYENYTRSDLMTATGTPDGTRITFRLMHRTAMVETTIQELLEEDDVIVILVDGIEVIPYKLPETEDSYYEETYRILIKPEQWGSDPQEISLGGWWRMVQRGGSTILFEQTFDIKQGTFSDVHIRTEDLVVVGPN
jgi:hypothetical protein